MATHHVRVGPLPVWLDAARLLGEGDWTLEDGTATARLDTRTAADLAARLRGLGLAGRPIAVDVRPRLKRSVVRAARTADARRRRDTTPGFTRSDARFDDEGRWSLTPEALATALGRRAARQLGDGAHVLDAGCGVGGNAIGFARAGLRVTAVEADAHRAAHARHNAGVYGVADRITVVHGDAVRVVADTPSDLVFADPPWGPDWDRHRTGADDLPLLAPLLAAAGARPVWLKAPPSFDPATLAGFDAEAWFGAASGDRRRIKFVLLTRG